MKCVRHKSYPSAIFAGASCAEHFICNHNEIARRLRDKKPYTITVLIENLDPELWKKKDYAQQVRIERPSRYIELLYSEFYADFGEENAGITYSKWLDTYRPLWLRENESKDLDSYIIRHELEPRYKAKIFKRFKKREGLFTPRYRIERERYYNLPAPFNYVDWRNPYDNIFLWYEGDRKLFVRGGSGSSGQRQINSAYLYGYALINQHAPVPSSLFIYDRKNVLWFVRHFPYFCVPVLDLGANYYLPSSKERNVLCGTKLFRWSINHEPIKEITFIER